MRKFFSRWTKYFSAQPVSKNATESQQLVSTGHLVELGCGTYISLRDSHLSGWWHHDTGELYTGFTIKAEDVVVDIGCGAGDNAKFCGMQGAHIIAIDMDAANIEITKLALKKTKARKIEGVVSNADPLPLAEGVASKVIASEIMEHVDNPAQFLKEIVRIGAPDAQYLLTVPGPEVEYLQKTLAPTSHFQKPNHIRIIERDEFAQLVTDAGLIVEQQSYCGAYWSIWWMFFWICGVDLNHPAHPLLESWNQTWAALMDSPNGEKVRRVLDNALPKRQIIIARKPS